jgi:hypothetical protein
LSIVDLGAAHDAEAARRAQPRDAVKALGAARRQEQEGPRRERAPGLEHELLLALGCRSGDDHRAAGGGAAETRGVGEGGGLGQVVLEVAEIPHPLGRRAERLDAVRVFARLHREERDARERAGEESPDPAVAREGARGDPAVDDGDRNRSGGRPIQEERPDLGLDQDDQGRPRPIERALHRSGELEGEGEDRLRRDVLAASSCPAAVVTEIPAGHRGGRQAAPEGAQEVRATPICRPDRVDPDAALEEGVRTTAQLPAESPSRRPPARDRTRA